MSGMVALIMGTNGAAASPAPAPAPAGQQAYTTAGTYSWTAPPGVTSVSVVCIGGGGAAFAGVGANEFQWGGGGALAYTNNITVVPGNSYTVVAGAVGASSGSGTDGGDSSFNSTSCKAGGGKTGPTIGVASLGGQVIYGDGGGAGGNSGAATIVYSRAGGGGAGGYSGAGGAGGNPGASGASGAGGGAGGGGGYTQGSGLTNAASGGGTGIFGEASSGTGGGPGVNGNPGSNGTIGATLLRGGDYGGGGAGSSFGSDGGGAVRIIWAGTSGITRAFPSTNTGDL